MSMSCSVMALATRRHYLHSWELFTENWTEIPLSAPVVLNDQYFSPSFLQSLLLFWKAFHQILTQWPRYGQLTQVESKSFLGM